MNKIDKFELLNSLVELKSERDNSFFKKHLPMSEHIKALSPNFYFVLGERGSGKTTLFKGAFENNLYKELVEYFKYVTPKINILWEKDNIDFHKNNIDILTQLVSKNGSFENYWLWGLLLLFEKNSEYISEVVQSINVKDDILDRLSNLEKQKDKIYREIFELEKRNKKENKIIIIGYDDLEYFSIPNHQLQEKFLEGLIQFWSSHFRRWDSIIPKIFIRTDIFYKNLFFQKKESEKFFQSVYEVKWKKEDLFNLLFKKIANIDDKTTSYLKNIAKIKPNKVFGNMIETFSDSLFEIFFQLNYEAGVAKGDVKNWVLSHANLKKDNYSPYIFLQIIIKAVELELETKDGNKNNLIGLKNFYDSIEKFSNEYVSYLIRKDLFWLEGLKERLAEHEIKTSPIEKNKFHYIIKNKWSDAWGRYNDGQSLYAPYKNPSNFISQLKELRIIEENKNNYDFADIFCYGLGLIRQSNNESEKFHEGTYYVYVMEDCITDARKFGLDSNLNSLKDRIHKNQIISNFDTSIAAPFRKKILPNNKMLICYEHVFEEKKIIIFLKIIGFSENEYQNFFIKYINDFVQLKKKYINERIIKNAEEYFNEQKNKIFTSNLPRVNAGEELWLYYNISIDENKTDRFIFESMEWVENIKKHFETQNMTHIYEDLLKVLRDSEVLNKDHSHHETYNYNIIYQYFEDINKIVLLDILEGKDYSSYLEKIENFKNPNLDIELEINKYCVRSYPDYILADRNIWFEVEKEDQANMSLSPEEVNIIKNVRYGNDKIEESGKRFPLFVNGRAGSGKTTVIQHILKPYLELSLLEKETEYHPIYLTYNRLLLDKAKETIRKLIKANYETLSASSQSVNIEKLNVIIEKSFFSFQDFLIEMLPKIKRSKFLLNKKIGYVEFKELFNAKFKYDDLKISADTVWHVIRTFIKGMKDVELGIELDFDRYRNIAKDLKTIDSKSYEKIYQNVYFLWYKGLCEKDGFWDDQDLVYEVMHKEYFKDFKYPCIVCDESQDFTKIELDLILNLSLFSRRKLTHFHLKNIPLIFAGDPMQTINPTGFRWENIQSLYYDQIIRNLDSSGSAKLQFNLMDLQFNYRSQGGIVRFLNIILLLRGTLFNIKNIEPQKIWREDHSPIAPIYYSIENNYIIKEILKDPSKLILIVNCDSSELAGFINNDEFLKSLPLECIYTPMEAKGSEWQTVILYKFGESAPEELKEYLSPQNKPFKSLDYDPDKHLSFVYFLNRLYVAASRPRKRLIIIDSKNALNSFWEFAKDSTDHLLKISKEYLKSDPKVWEEKTFCPMIEGGSEGIFSEGNRPEKIGDELFEIGKESSDIEILKKAKYHFNLSNQHSKAIECEAIIFEIQNKFLDSAKKYKEIQKYKEVVNCFVKNKSYSEILELSDKQEIMNSLELFGAKLILKEDKLENFKKSLEYFTKKIRIDSNKLRRKEWIWMCERILEKWNSLSKDACIPEFLEILNESVDSGIELQKSTFGILARNYHLLNVFSNSYKYFELADQRNSPEYKEVRAFTIPYPENLLDLFEIKNYSKIISEYEKIRNFKYSLEQITCIVKTYLEKENFTKILEIIQKESRLKSVTIKEIIKRKILKSNFDELFFRFLYVYFEKLFLEKEYVIIKKWFEDPRVRFEEDFSINLNYDSEQIINEIYDNLITLNDNRVQFEKYTKAINNIIKENIYNQSFWKLLNLYLEELFTKKDYKNIILWFKDPIISFNTEFQREFRGEKNEFNTKIYKKILNQILLDEKFPNSISKELADTLKNKFVKPFLSSNTEQVEDWSECFNYVERVEDFIGIIEKLDRRIHSLSFYKYLYVQKKGKVSIDNIRDLEMYKDRYKKAIENRISTLPFADKRVEELKNEIKKIEDEFNLIESSINISSPISRETKSPKEVQKVLSDNNERIVYNFKINKYQVEIKVNLKTGIVKIDYKDDDWKINLINDEVSSERIEREKKIDSIIYSLKELDIILTFYYSKFELELRLNLNFKDRLRIG